MALTTLRRSASFLLFASALLAGVTTGVSTATAPGARDARAELRAPALPLRRDNSVMSTLGWADREVVPRVLGLFDSYDDEHCGCESGGWIRHDSCVHLRDDTNA